MLDILDILAWPIAVVISTYLISRAISRASKKS